MLHTVNTTTSTGWPAGISAKVFGTRQTVHNHPPSRDRVIGRSNVTGDIAQLYPEAVTVSSDSFAWQNIRLVHLQHRLETMTVPGADNHCLVLNLSAPIEIAATFGKRQFGGTLAAGEIAIIPAGCSWICESNGSHLQSMVLLYLRPLFVRGALENLALSGELLIEPDIGFPCKQIRHLALSLLDEIQESHVSGRLYADSLALGLAMQLIRRYTFLKGVQIEQGGMAPHRLRKAMALIDKHLEKEEEGRVALRVVAKEVGMSYFHFSRAFKQTLGMSPTNYIAERRIEHAKRLMQETALPISEIALRSGFSSQSHFTTSFRRFSGVTPRSFRRGI
jgi:AraC family transcriptional regulator